MVTSPELGTLRAMPAYLATKNGEPTVCLPLHALEDTLEEERLGDGAYGSTRQGIAPAYGDRVMKKGILVGWLNQPEILEQRIQFLLDCRATLVSGKVDYNEEPLAFVRDGEILLCCCKPNGDIHIKL